MDADAILYQDVTEIVDADVIPVQYSEEITAVYGLFFFSSSAEETHGITTAVDVTIAVSGSSFFFSSVEETHGITMAADVMTAANQTNFKDGNLPSFFHATRAFCVINLPE